MSRSQDGPPPLANPDAEAGLVAAALAGAADTDPSPLSAVQPDDLTDRRLATVWGAAQAVYQQSKAPGLIAVKDELSKRDALDAVGGTAWLAELMETYQDYVYFSDYATEVLEWSRRRKALAAITDLGTMVGRDGHFDAALDNTIMALAKLRKRREPADEDAGESMPALPDDARPAGDTGAGGWLDIYTYHGLAVSPMTPALFHDSAGLWLASVAIARRLVLPMSFDNIFPNLYICWIAPTTLYRKSTALSIARRVAYRVIPHLMAAQDTTPEALLSDMAGLEPARLEALSDQQREEWRAGRAYAGQRGLIIDELSGLLAASGRDYMSGMIEAFLRFYDCSPFKRSTRQQGLVIVSEPYLSILAASTPAALAQHLAPESRLWVNGFWPRFALLCPEEERPTWTEPRVDDIDPATGQQREPAELTAGLRALYERLPATVYPDPPRPLAVTIHPDAFAAWTRYNRALGCDLLTALDGDGLRGVYGRLPAAALKVATILAALDWTEDDKRDSPQIDPPHLARAVRITEQWRASAHRALDGLRSVQFDNLRRRILRVVGSYAPTGASARDVYRAMQDKRPRDVLEELERMTAEGLLYSEWIKPARGRPAERYHVMPALS